MSNKTVAIFCFEEPASAVGRFAADAARLLASRGHPVLIFSRLPLSVETPGVVSHAIGECVGEDLIGAVRAFTLRASAAFNAAVPPEQNDIALIGCEWSVIPVLQILGAMRKLPVLLCLQSLERQRSDMIPAASLQIEMLEIQGLHQAKSVLIRGRETAELAKKIVPDCAPKIAPLAESFPISDFQKPLDPGEIKKRYQIGPVDPTVLFFGPLDEDHGPDLLMKAVPLILKKHKQARFIFVGDGPLFWMLRIHARYLNLDHAVRIAGHMAGETLFELVQASDIVIAPGRKPSSHWPLLAGWSAGKAVIATHEAAQGLIAHEQNGVLIYPLADSVAWGVDRILSDTALWSNLVENGKRKIGEEFGGTALAGQLEQALAGL